MRQFGNDTVQHAVKVRSSVRGDRLTHHRTAHPERHISQFFTESDTLLRQGDYHLAGILITFAAYQNTLLLHALKQRRNGIGFKIQPVCNVIDRL